MMKYTNRYLGVEVRLDHTWTNVSLQLGNVDQDLKELYQIDEMDLPSGEDDYKYLLTCESMSANRKVRKTNILLCVHRLLGTNQSYRRFMMAKLNPESKYKGELKHALVQGSCRHGDFNFDFVDQIGMGASIRHAWVRLYDDVWLYIYCADYFDLLNRPALKWLGKLRSVPRIRINV